MAAEINNHQPVFWNTSSKSIPPRPDNPEFLEETDRGRWYDQEYAGWNSTKAKQPQPPSDGVRGKRIAAFLAGNHPYLAAYQRGLERTAESFGLVLEIYNSMWDPVLQEQQVEEVLKNPPHMILIMPENNHDSSYLYQYVYEAGIPVIAANMVPEDSGFPYILSWAGPDDWEQTRALSRRFGELMDGKGGYAVLCHIEETSTFYARKWGAITEISDRYPRMKCLASESAGLNREKTKNLVLKWIEEFGEDLKGIISADDNVSQLGINDALVRSGREDIIRAANGSTEIGIGLVKDDKLDLITWQDPEMDGELPIQIAVDWFNGLAVTPLRYLPVRILDKSNIDSILNESAPFSESHPDALYQCILEIDREGVDFYFDRIINEMAERPGISSEYVQGFSIEILSNLLNLIKTEELEGRHVIGTYEDLFKNLMRQRTAEGTVKWLKNISLDLLNLISAKRSSPKSMGRIIADYVHEHFDQPMSLKTLSVHFNLSAPYLGQLFREETGEVFSSYLNRIRIEKAGRLLDRTSQSASQVAIAVGFSSSNYFFRTFHKLMGCSPVEYKTRHQSADVSPDE